MKAWQGIMGAGMILVLSGGMARSEVFLVDLGTEASFRGVGVTSPDSNGKHWNGYAPGDGVKVLTNTANQAGPVRLEFTSSLATDSYNGPAGVTTDPPTPTEIAATAIEADALGDLGITNAAFDYFEAAAGDKVKFTLSNLDPSKRYSLTFFGARKYPGGEVAGSPPSRTTVYAVTESNGTLLANTTLNVGVFGDHNSNQVATLTGLQPDSFNRLYVEFSGMTASNAGYLNAFRLESETVTPPPPDESILIDLGSADSYNGASVANPDSNGNYWNSVWSGAFYADVVNTSNTVTQVDFGFDVAGGTDNYNGPGGVIAAAALGALGGATNAVNDYYTSSRFQIQGLNPFRRYNLTFFGSHAFSVNDTTLYSVFSDSAYTQLVARVGLQVQVPESPWLHNSNTVAILTNLVPQAGNILYVQFEGNAGDNGYLNAMKIDVYIPDPTYDSWAFDYPGLGGRFADDDNDGWDNLTEFALGGDPTNNANNGYVPTARLTNLDGTNQIVYAFGRRSSNSGLTYHLETASHLVPGDWSDSGYTTSGTTGMINDQFESVTNWVNMVDQQRYIRLVIDEVP